jgi:hypothetical protein
MAYAYLPPPRLAVVATLHRPRSLPGAFAAAIAAGSPI